MLATINVLEEGRSNEPTPTKASRSTQKHRNTRQGSQKNYLSPPRQINSEVDVISGKKSRAINECHMTQAKQAEFYKQLNDLLAVGFISLKYHY